MDTELGKDNWKPYIPNTARLESPSTTSGLEQDPMRSAIFCPNALPCEGVLDYCKNLGSSEALHMFEPLFCIVLLDGRVHQC